MRETIAAALADISLPDTNGEQTRLGSLWAEGPAIVVFLRHYGWIFCRDHVAQLRGHEDEFSRVGARLAAIGLGDPSYARAFREETGITFPLFVDEDRRAFRAAELRMGSLRHLLRRDNFSARKRAKAAGRKQRRLGKNPFQLGASLVLAPGNVDRYIHRSKTFGDNANPAAILEAIRG